MATYYVSSVSGDNTTATTWATAKTSIAAALALATADGDIIEVDSAHVFTSSGVGITYNLATTNTSVSVISVNRNGSTTTGNSGWLAGAKETCGTTGFLFAIFNGTVAQTGYFYGIIMESPNGVGGSDVISIGAAGTNSVENRSTFDTCTFNSRGTSTSAAMGIGITPNSSRNHTSKFINCTFNLKNNNANNAINFSNGIVEIINPTIGYSGASHPPVLFGPGLCQQLTISDADLTGFTSGNYFDMAGQGPFNVVVRNCKLHATPGLTTGTFSTSGSITLINVDSGNTFTQFQYQNILGTLTSSTSVYDNSSATINATNVGWKVVTTSTASESRPFVLPWMSRYSTSTSSTVASIKVIHDSVTNLHDRNLWAEFEYTPDAADTKGTNVSVRNAQPFLGTSADWGADTDTWTGTGGFTNPNKQAVSSTFTPGQASLVRGRLLVGVAAKTLYLDPLLRLV